jgi:hypothetical protein
MLAMGFLDESTCNEEIRDECKDSIRTKFKTESTVNNAQNRVNDNSKRKRVIELPLEIKIRLLCKWRDSKLHPVKLRSLSVASFLMGFLKIRNITFATMNAT